MTTITLHDYLQKINELIEERLLDEAVAHCRHILQQIPRHVDTYRVMAKVLLEQGDYRGATDLLQRILSADPNDFFAHVGLSMTYKEDAMMRQSIWHLERALEIKPYNTALQEELHEAYLEFETAVPDSFPPSQAALSRIYLQSEMYSQAAEGLRQILNQDDDRIDLKVVLAETLWHDNNRVEAAALCTEILDVLPNCVQANAILGEIWLKTGRTEEAQTYLERLQALAQVDRANCDIETAVGRASLTKGAPPLPEKVTIDYLDVLPSGMFDEGSTADWASEVSFPEETDTVAENDSGTFDWLSEISLAGAGDTTSDEPSVDTIKAESDWFIDSEDQVDDLAGLLDQVVGSDELAEEEEDKNIFDKAGIVEDEDVNLSALFAEIDVADPSDPGSTDDDPVTEFEDIFADLDTDNISDPDAESETSDTLTDLLADLDQSQPETTDQEDVESDSDDDLEDDGGEYHTGYTGLFEELSSEAYPEDEVLDTSPESNVPDWLSVTEDVDFEPVQIDNRLTSDWLTDLDESDDEDSAPDDSESLPESEEAEREDVTVPTWMLGEDSDDEVGEPIPPMNTATLMASVVDDFESVDEVDDDTVDEPTPSLNTAALMASVVDDLENIDDDDEVDDTAVPAWLLGSELVEAETNLLESPPQIEEVEDVEDVEEAETSVAEQLIEDNLAALAGAELPDWLLDDDSEMVETDDEPVAKDIAEPDLDSKASQSGETDLFESDDELPDWLMGDAPTIQDEMEEAVISDNDEREMNPVEDPEEIIGDTPDELDDFAKEIEQLASEKDPSPEDLATLFGDESASFASRIAAGEGGAIDEMPTQVSLPDEEADSFLDDMLSASDSQDGDDLGWLDQLGDAAVESPDETSLLDWSEEGDGTDDLLEEVAGEVDADLDWLNTVSEETDAAVEQLSDSAEEGDLEAGALEWLDELASVEGIEPVQELGTEPELPDFEGSLTELPDESEESLEWLSTMEDEIVEAPDLIEETADTPAADPTDTDMADLFDMKSEIVEQPDLEQTLDEAEALTDVPEDMDEAMAWLEGLAAKQGAPLEELPTVTAEPELIIDDLDGVVAPVSEEIVDLDHEQDDIADDTEDAIGRLDGLAEGQDTILTDIVEEPEKLFSDTEVETFEGEQEPVVDALGDFGIETDTTDDRDDATSLMGDLSPETDEVDLEPVLEVEPDAELMTALEDLDTEASLKDAEDLTEAPEDLDEAMGWLEELAAKQGAPLEELPSIAEVVDVVDEEPAIESRLEIEPELEVAEPVIEAELVDDEAPDELAEALDWLEQLAVEEGAELGDAASMLEETAVAGSENELDEALDWLEQMAQPEEEPVEAVVEAVQPTSEEEALFDLAEEMPDDPDEALAWLGHLTVDEDEMVVEDEIATAVPVEEEATAETGFVTEITEPDVEETAVLEEPVVEVEEIIDTAEAEIEADVLSEIPDDPDAAMAWLEQLAAKQGARLEELPSISTEQDLVVEPLDEVVELDIESDKELESDLVETLGESLDEAKDAFEELDELVEEPDISLTDSADFVTAKLEIETLEEQLETESTPVDVVESVDDVTAQLDELPPLVEKSESELDTTDFGISSEAEIEVEEDTGADDVMDTQETGIETLFAAEEAAAEEAAVEDVAAEEAVVEETTIEEVAIEEVEPEVDGTGKLPEWLDSGDLGEEIKGETDWLGSLGEPDVPGWLEAEEDATISGVFDRSALTQPDPQPDISGDVGISSPDAPEVEPRWDTGSLVLPTQEEQVESVLDLDNDQLATAREAIKDGNFDSALQAYQSLMDDGGGMMVLISDLEKAVEDNMDQPLFRHLLGDAYMRNGQLQKALDTYRSALDQI